MPDPWSDDDQYLHELIEQIIAAAPQPVTSYVIDPDNKVLTLTLDNPLSVSEFNRFHKHHWPIEVAIA